MTTQDKAKSAIDRLLGGAPAPQDDTKNLLDTIRSGIEQAPETAVDSASAVVDWGRSLVTGEGRKEFELQELGTSGPYEGPYAIARNLDLAQKGRPLGARYESSAPPPSIEPITPEGMRMAAAYAVSVTPEQIADIAMKTLPGAARKEDRFGNPIITFEGQDFYINRPGLTEADLYQFLSEAALYAPSARAGLATRSIPGRAWRVGSRAAGTSAGLDAASMALGSEQGISGPRMAMAGTLGGAFELMAPLAKSFWRWAFRRNDMLDRATGTLTEKGKAAALAADLNPDEMTPELIEAFAREARDEPLAEVAKSRALTETQGIKYTAGEQSKSRSSLALEEGMRHGTKGPEAQGTMLAFRKGQQEAGEEAAERVQAKIGGVGVKSESEGARVLNEALEREVQKLDNRIEDAYEISGGFDANLKRPENFGNLLSSVKKEIEEFSIDPELFPATTKIVKMIGAMVPSGKKPAMAPMTGVAAPKPKKITLRDIEMLRRRVAKQIDAAKSRADRSAAVMAKRKLDQWVDEAVDKALFEGDDQALDALLNARAVRAEKGRKFEVRKTLKDPDEAGAIIQKMVERNPTPEQTVNWLFGMSRLGNKQTSTKVAERIKTIFPEGSTEWNVVREMGWLRLTKDKAGNFVSAKQLEKNLNETLYQNPTLMKTLYTRDEILLMKELSAALKQTVVQRESLQPSKTAFTIMRAVRDLIRRAGTHQTFSGRYYTGGLFFTLGRWVPVEPMQELGKSTLASRAVKGVPRYGPRAPELTAGGLAATQLQPGENQ